LVRTLQMAWRNLWRNGRRSVVTIAAMAFALWVMLLYSGMIRGMLRQMESSVLDMEVGSIQVTVQGYQDDPSLYQLIDDPQAIVDQVQQLGGTAAARLLGGGLAGVGQSSAGVSIVGIDVARDGRVVQVSQQIEQGAWLDPTDPKGAVIGRKLARTLGAKVGDELLLLSQAADGSVANDLYTIKGVLGTVSDPVDRTTVFLTQGAFRDLMVVPTGAQLITVRMPPSADLDATAAALTQAHAGLDVKTWRQIVPIVATMMASTKSIIGLVSFLLYFAVAILVLNGMLMVVFERIREFGVMKAIGYGPGTVFRLICVEAGLQALLATTTALLLALPAMVYMQTVGINVGALSGMSVMGMTLTQNWRGLYTPDQAVTPIISLWVMIGLAALWPAVKAARIRPLDAMRYL